MLHDSPKRQSGVGAVKSECEAELEQLVRALRAVRKEIADQHEMVRKGPERPIHECSTHTIPDRPIHGCSELSENDMQGLWMIN